MAHLANITINRLLIPSDQTDAVLGFSLADAPASVHAVLTADAGDLRLFKDDGTTGLPREIEFYDPVLDDGYVWFKYTGLLSIGSDTVVQLHADGVSTEPAFTDPLGRNEVWSDYASVSHFRTDGLDSTGNGNTFIAAGAGSVVFNDGYVSIAAGGWLDTLTNFSGPSFTDGYHIKFVWDNPTSQAFAARQLSASQGGNSGVQLSESLLIRHNGNNQTVSTAGIYGGGEKPVEATWDNTSNGLATYVNGALDGTGTSFQTPSVIGATSVPLSLYSHGDAFRALEGDLYEFWWRNESSDAARIEMEENNRSDPAFYTITEVSAGVGAISPNIISGEEFQEVHFSTVGDSHVRTVGDAQINLSTQIAAVLGTLTATLTWDGTKYSGPATDIATALSTEVGNDERLTFVYTA